MAPNRARRVRHCHARGHSVLPVWTRPAQGPALPGPCSIVAPRIPRDRAARLPAHAQPARALPSSSCLATPGASTHMRRFANPSASFRIRVPRARRTRRRWRRATCASGMDTLRSSMDILCCQRGRFALPAWRRSVQPGSTPGPGAWTRRRRSHATAADSSSALVARGAGVDAPRAGRRRPCPWRRRARAPGAGRGVCARFRVRPGRPDRRACASRRTGGWRGKPGEKRGLWSSSAAGAERKTRQRPSDSLAARGRPEFLSREPPGWEALV